MAIEPGEAPLKRDSSRRRRQGSARYVLSIGDLSIDQVLQIGDACAQLSPGLAAKVRSSVTATWDAYQTADLVEKLWDERNARR